MYAARIVNTAIICTRWEKKFTVTSLDTSLKCRAYYHGVATFGLVAAGDANMAVISSTMIYKLLRQ